MIGTRALGQRWASDAMFERVIEAGFLSDEDLEIFHRLIKQQQSLPLYLGVFWRCYECQFESSDLAAMGAHLMGTHEPVAIRTQEYALSQTDRSSEPATIVSQDGAVVTQSTTSNADEWRGRLASV